jgi:hypothetical protein
MSTRNATTRFFLHLVEAAGLGASAAIVWILVASLARSYGLDNLPKVMIEVAGCSVGVITAGTALFVLYRWRRPTSLVAVIAAVLASWAGGVGLLYWMPLTVEATQICLRAVWFALLGISFVPPLLQAGYDSLAKRKLR